MRATIARDADTAVALLRKHRSATLADVAARWPAREDVAGGLGACLSNVNTLLVGRLRPQERQ